MAVNVLALASGVTGLADHRGLEGSFATSGGVITTRTGLFPSTGAADKSTVSAMVARVAPFRAIINNSISSALGPYLMISTANVDITFADGEASVVRTDRIIARVRDNANDGSGSTAGSVEYLKGQASGAATAMPNNSMLLYQMNVPAGASAGGGGINFANMTDSRTFTTASGGIIPVPGATEMNAISSPYWGQAVYRTDLDCLYIWDGGNWRPKGQISVAASANLTNITNPWDGLQAVARDTNATWVYNGSTWQQPVPLIKPYGNLIQQSAQSVANGGGITLTFGSGSEDMDSHNFHDMVTNNSRVTPNIAGVYRVTAYVCMVAATYTQVAATLAKNGTNLNGRVLVRPDAASSSACTAIATSLVSCNGTTDYFEAAAGQSSSGTQNTSVSAGFASSLSWEYVSPLTY